MLQKVEMDLDGSEVLAAHPPQKPPQVASDGGQQLQLFVDRRGRFGRPEPKVQGLNVFRFDQVQDFAGHLSWARGRIRRQRRHRASSHSHISPGAAPL
ncbi:MAG: hypothetical protein ACK5AZ_14010 [Bryobacteraceae bacterium]